MICKWCGEVLKPGDSRCKRCRREIPALSDCGGFYDLVPQAESALPVAAQQPKPAPVEVRPERVPPIPVQSARRKQDHMVKNIVFWVAIVLAVVFLVQTISLSGKLETAEAQIRMLKDRNDSQNEDVNNISGNKPEVKPGETPDPVQPEDTLTVAYNGSLTKIPFTAGNCEALKTQRVTVQLQDEAETILASVMLELKTDENAARVLSLTVSAEGLDWKDLSFRWSIAEDPAAELVAFDILAEVAQDTTEETTDDTSENTSGSFFGNGNDETEPEEQSIGSELEIDWEGKKELICEITATDSTGETVHLILTGIVIE